MPKLDRYLAAVVQAPLHGTNDRMPIRELMQRNGERWARIVEGLIAASDEPPTLFVLPVLAINGIGTALRRLGRSLPTDPVQTALDLATDPALDPLYEVCARRGVYVATSGVEKHPAMPGHRFHTAFILGPDGLVVRNPKTQAKTSAGISLLQNVAEEYRAVFGPDAILSVADTPIGRLTCLVEGEYLVPEAVRVVADHGAQVVCHPTAQFSEPGRPPAPALQQAHAYTHAVYWLSAVAASEIVDLNEGRVSFQFGGGSVICGPNGEVKALISGPEEGHAIAAIDFSELDALQAARREDTTPVPAVYLRAF